ncbi:MAG: hypothetical protein ACM3WR_07285 [Solirubrobacterales bacterium]
MSRIEVDLRPKTAELLDSMAAPAGTTAYDGTFLVRGVTDSVTERPRRAIVEI